ncbi:MAG TPA: cytochrome c-type biogenesis protein CcmH [Gemmatimonadales bacterium]|nr:cytochrome c-type biogenesis protein CcmH [Gemmatimonadales bacterium]
MSSRRAFLRCGLAFIVAPPVQDSLAGRGAVGTLRDPSVAGRPRAPTDPGENAAEIQAIELKLACNCGCTLDVFTCRTTDFSCTYSPKLHREVLTLRNDGLSAQQVIDAFVDKYGEKALMAPKPQGFNLAGYLVPGAVIALAGGALVLLIGRRKATVASGAEDVPRPTAVQGSPDEMERLRRALSEVDD